MGFQQSIPWVDPEPPTTIEHYFRYSVCATEKMEKLENLFSDAGEITIIKTGRSKDSAEVAAAKQAAIEARKPIDEKILTNLLRLNLARASNG